jgi:hypothetical protein
MASLSPTSEPARPREEVIKEIELILEAKKNINNILTTMYYVFYALLLTPVVGNELLPQGTTIP